MTMVHATVQPGARLDLPWDAEYNALVYVLSGQGTVGDEGRPVRTGNLAVLGAGDFVTVHASGSQESRTPALDVIVIGGQPIREPVAWGGPFVMNTKAEVLAAFEDFQKGRLGTIPTQMPACTERRPPRSAPRTESRDAIPSLPVMVRSPDRGTERTYPGRLTWRKPARQQGP